MSTMHFADEIVPRSDIEGLPRRSKPDAKALKMALQIIDSLSSEWDPKRYSDTYTEELRRRIRRKDSGKEVVESTDKPAGRVLDLMAALEASVDAAKKRRAPRKSTRKTA
jgi:DNA end-binding protein Ku